MTPETQAALDRLRDHGRYPEPYCTAHPLLNYRADLAHVAQALADLEADVKDGWSRAGALAADLVQAEARCAALEEEVRIRAKWCEEKDAVIGRAGLYRGEMETKLAALEAATIERCAQWLRERAQEHEKIAVDRIKADRADEIALTHKSMSDTYYYAAQNIHALRPEGAQ